MILVQARRAADGQVAAVAEAAVLVARQPPPERLVERRVPRSAAHAAVRGLTAVH
jgi:hypothetical protein